jgi:hypothetical protein
VIDDVKEIISCHLFKMFSLRDDAITEVDKVVLTISQGSSHPFGHGNGVVTIVFWR